MGVSDEGVGWDDGEIVHDVEILAFGFSSGRIGISSGEIIEAIRSQASIGRL